MTTRIAPQLSNAATPNRGDLPRPIPNRGDLPRPIPNREDLKKRMMELTPGFNPMVPSMSNPIPAPGGPSFPGPFNPQSTTGGPSFPFPVPNNPNIVTGGPIRPGMRPGSAGTPGIFNPQSTTGGPSFPGSNIPNPTSVDGGPQQDPFGGLMSNPMALFQILSMFRGRGGMGQPMGGMPASQPLGFSPLFR